ncbi:3-oxoacyl-[acyl-carrier-protein] reductase [soil metagenome]
MKGLTAVVTGAGSGNGRAIAEAFAAHGANVVCADRDAASAIDTVRRIEAVGGAALAATMDVTSADDCKGTTTAAADRFGAIDVLVNNAGVLIRGGLLELSEAQWDLSYGVNVKGCFLMSKAAAPYLKARRGNIVNVASVAGLRGSGGHLAYSSSKHALVGMTKCMALELGAAGVRVNAVCPGLVDTPMLNDVAAAQLESRGKGYPLGRIGQPADVADAVLHLASAEASWVTGHCYVTDGGSLLGAG